MLAGAGIGFLLGPASTDAVNRAINASYGEVTGITQTLRNYGSSLGLAILGTTLLSVSTSKIVSSLTGLGVPQAQAREVASQLSSGTPSGSGGAPSGVPPELADRVFAAIRVDYAEATQVVFYGMAGALVVSLLFSLFHPGGKVTDHQPSEADAPSVPA